MPVYEYFCDKCKDKFEVFRGAAVCPECGTRGRRIPSVTAWRPDYTVRQ